MWYQKCKEPMEYKRGGLYKMGGCLYKAASKTTLNFTNIKNTPPLCYNTPPSLHVRFDSFVKKRMRLFFPLLLLTNTFLFGQSDFVTVTDGHFEVADSAYFCIGANYWYGVQLAAGLQEGDRDRLRNELDQLKKLGINNLRIMVGSEGPANAPYRIQPTLQDEPGVFDTSLLLGLDLIMEELAQRDMRAVLCLTNFFHWSGGMAQYVAWATKQPIPYPHTGEHSWTEFQEYSATFYQNRRAKKWFRQFIRTLTGRTNQLNGRTYRADPTIMAWQLANEPRGFSQADAYVKWVRKTAALLQRQAPNHLISLGGEGFLPNADIGTRFEEVSEIKHLDYLTVHVWAENWGWYQPAEPGTYVQALEKAILYLDRHLPIAAATEKPIVLEEFGLSRDGGSHDPDTPTTIRDHYFSTILDYIYEKSAAGQGYGGLNFWSWSGEGRPPRPAQMWKPTDPLTGDPPHELQGWYSVYSTDTSTLEVIHHYAKRTQALGAKERASALR